MYCCSQDIENLPWFHKAKYILVGHQHPEIPYVGSTSVTYIHDNFPKDNTVFAEYIQPTKEFHTISAGAIDFMWSQGCEEILLAYNFLYVAIATENFQNLNNLIAIHNDETEQLKILSYTYKVPEHGNSLSDTKNTRGLLAKTNGKTVVDEIIDARFHSNAITKYVWNGMRTNCIAVIRSFQKSAEVGSI